MRAFLNISLLLIAVYPASALEYEKDIMPIFEKKCFECHSNKAEKTKGGLRLDDPAHFLGRFEKDDLVQPGQPKMSGLYYSLTRPRFDKGAMPPEKKGDQLTEKEVELIRDWIAEGAPINGTRGKRGKPQEEDASPAKSMPPIPKEKAWTNRDGKTIRATLLKIEGNIAVLRMKGGAVYRYPITQLSDQSQAELKKSEP